MKEIWKTIEGFSRYKVSSQGNVKNNKTGRILKPSFTNKGYLMVSLSKDSKVKRFLLHRLVALHFLPDKNECVNHKDGNKLNNCVSNLEWTTNLQNQKHAWDTGLFASRSRMCLDLKTGVYYDTASSFSRAKGINRSTLHKHLMKNKDYGFDVKYV
jgi:hypothetical protein